MAFKLSNDGIPFWQKVVLFMKPGATKVVSGIHSGSTYQPQPVDQALADAAAASQVIASLKPDITLASVSGARVIDAVGPQTVINITGNITLSGSNLYLRGPEGSKFLINVFGGLSMGGSAIIGGFPGSAIKGSDVIVNMVGIGTTVKTQINNVVKGTILGPNRQFELHSVNGAVIGGSRELKLMSDCTVRYEGCVSGTPPPPPPTGELMISRNLVLQGTVLPVGYAIHRSSN